MFLSFLQKIMGNWLNTLFYGPFFLNPLCSLDFVQEPVSTICQCPKKCFYIEKKGVCKVGDHVKIFTRLNTWNEAPKIMVRYAVPQKVLVQEVMGETVILDTEKGEYFELNSLGSVLFARLAALEDPKLVVTEMLKEYDVDESVLVTDFNALISRLEESGLIIKKEMA